MQLKDREVVVAEMDLQVPAFYKEQGIPKVRWMYPGKSYKARLITVSRKYDAAIMFLYVVDDKHVIAFGEAEMTNEIGMLLLKHFEKISELSVEGIPAYSSVFPKALTYGELLEVPQHVTKTVGNVSETPKVVTKEAESVTDTTVLVTITPPEPPMQYEQLTLF